MYQQKMAAAIKAGGKVLREFGETVYLPFGSEYSILIKNLNSVRALVTITIDGDDVLDGNELIVYPNSEITIERFIRNGNMNAGNRFKFTERTEEVEAHRGAKVSDGLVRIEYKFEKRISISNPNHYHTHYHKYYDSRDNGGWYTTSDNTSFSSRSPTRSMSTDTISSSSQAYSLTSASNVGFTAPGSVSDQRFVAGDSFDTELETYTMVFQLLGETEQQVVSAPVTVKTKATCSSCGNQEKATAKFCSRCGTSVTLV